MSQWRLSDADQRPLASQLQDSDCRRTRLSSKFVIQICPSFLLTYEMTSSFETLSFFAIFGKRTLLFMRFLQFSFWYLCRNIFPFRDRGKCFRSCERNRRARFSCCHLIYPKLRVIHFCGRTFQEMFKTKTS